MAYGAYVGSVTNAHVRHNRIAYDTSHQMDPAAEHRALVLIGALSARFSTGSGVIEVAQGGAIVTDNYFQGLGLTRLVQIPRLLINASSDLRFEKLVFGNNRCDHTGRGGDDSITADLFASHVIVTSNHVKSPPGSFSIGLGERPQVALLANCTTGNYFGVNTTVPAPLNNFNVRV